ncbi:MAG: peptidoglycan-binding domain-containing protein, partial [Stellaceae bacterium]
MERRQRDHGLAAIGTIDQATREAMRVDTSRITPATVFPLGERAAVQQLQSRLQQLGLYHGVVNGNWGPEMRQALQSCQRVRGGLDVTGRPTKATMSALGIAAGGGATVEAGSPSQPLDPAVVRSIERRLRADGFYNGQVDGVWGPETQERDHALPA